MICSLNEKHDKRLLKEHTKNMECAVIVKMMMRLNISKHILQISFNGSDIIDITRSI